MLVQLLKTDWKVLIQENKVVVKNILHFFVEWLFQLAYLLFKSLDTCVIFIKKLQNLFFCVEISNDIHHPLQNTKNTTECVWITLGLESSNNLRMNGKRLL